MELLKILDSGNGNKLIVRAATGESFSAPLMTIGNSSTYPSKDWINSNKNNFLAIVSYEGTGGNSPCILGFYPVKGADSSSYNNFERLLLICTKLLEQLLIAKTNTMLGPQSFMPDTIQVLEQLKKDLDSITKNILPLKK